MSDTGKQAKNKESKILLPQTLPGTDINSIINVSKKYILR